MSERSGRYQGSAPPWETDGSHNVRGAERRACRLKPAFQAGGLILSVPRLVFHAARVVRVGGVTTCAAQSAARAGLETGVPSRHAIPRDGVPAGAQ